MARSPGRPPVWPLLEAVLDLAAAGVAEDGEAAVRQCGRSCDDPGAEVVLADLGLPGLDGLGLARAAAGG